MFARATQPTSATVTGIVPPQQYGNMPIVPNLGTGFNASMAPSMMGNTNVSMNRGSMMTSGGSINNPMMRSSSTNMMVIK